LLVVLADEGQEREAADNGAKRAGKVGVVMATTSTTSAAWCGADAARLQCH